jgi:4-carboxymuconolactone decarboxylase
MAMRRKVLGDRHVDAAIAKTDDFTADFQDLITRYAWGEIWTRPGLDERVRRYLTIAMLACLGRDEELAMHVRAAAEGRVGADEIKEVLLQVAVYGGVPAANRAFAIAQPILRDLGGGNADQDAGD